MDQDLWVVILNFNAPSLVRCVNAVLAEGVAKDRVIVVDNGSRDDSIDSLLAAHADIEVIQTGANLGYAGGNNVGIRTALDRGAKWVLLPNPDAFLMPGALAALFEAADSAERVAAIGGLVMDSSSPRTVDGAYGVINYRQFLSRLEGEGSRRPDAYRSVLEVDYPYGCAMLLSASALREVGLFDENFFLYHEELEWCYRARRAGFKVLFTPKARVEHGRSGDNLARAALRRYMLARNSMLFMRKHGTLATRFRFAVFVAAGLPFDALKWTLAGRGREVRACVKGYLDGLLGRPPDPGMIALATGRSWSA